jgi:hypothetical protein
MAAAVVVAAVVAVAVAEIAPVRAPNHALNQAQVRAPSHALNQVPVRAPSRVLNRVPVRAPSRVLNQVPVRALVLAPLILAGDGMGSIRTGGAGMPGPAAPTAPHARTGISKS